MTGHDDDPPPPGRRTAPGRRNRDAAARGGLAGGPRTLLTETGAIVGRRLRRMRRAPGRSIGVVLNPLLSLIMLGYLFRDAITLPMGGDYVEYVFAGGAVQVGLACVGPTAVSSPWTSRAASWTGSGRCPSAGPRCRWATRSPTGWWAWPAWP